MSVSTVGLLHPGEMGAAIGGALVGKGCRVLWASEGRSAETRRRAEEARFEDVGSAATMAKTADVILSVCPPSVAIETAKSIGNFEGIYVDANAVSPETARAVAEIVVAVGATFVDGGIIGGPPRHPGDARLHLSGPGAAEVSDLFADTAVIAPVLGDRIGDASALKCAYAAWTKGSSALLLAARQYARAAGVEGPLIAEWSESQPTLEGRWERSVASAKAKGWRWTGEMREIASAFEAESLPGGFHRAAAEIFEQGDARS
jgi:3-hydroxyisobutyrate dehydrogenase-like beta-hydroxyacid dehydrogenase